MSVSTQTSAARSASAAFALLIATAGIVQGQVSDPILQTKIVDLKHSRAEALQEAVQSLVADQIRTAVDGNRLIMRGTAEQLEMATALAAELDRPDESEVLTVPVDLSWLPDDRNAAQGIVRFAERNANLNIYRDPSTKVMLVSGNPEEVAKFVKLLEEMRNHLVRAQAEQIAATVESDESNEQFLVRLAWLVASPQRPELTAKMSPVPEDLKSVAAELVNVGMASKADEIRLGTQLLVVATDGSFRMSGQQWQASPEATSPYNVELEGTLSASANGGVSKNLQIERFQVSRSRGGRDPGEPDILCSFSSSVTAPVGQSVVLGMAPTGDMSSAAVIQIRPMIKGEAFSSKIGESR